MKKSPESNSNAGVPPKLQHWEWVWVRGRDARATAAEDSGATASGATKTA